MVSYELAIGFVLVTVLLVSGSLNMSEIVMGQTRGWFADKGLNFLSWNWLPLLPLFVIYVISAVAETNRHPFDVVEGESEIVAGHMVEYSGMAFALFFLGEYANMILLSCMASIMFLGGWTAPIEIAPLTWVPGWIWLGLKTFVVVSLFVWFRASFPRYRYDQIMRLGWKIFIPLTGVWLVVVAIWMQTPWNIGAKPPGRHDMEAIKDFFGSLMLTELLKGMRLTGKYFFKRKVTLRYPRKRRRCRRVSVACTRCAVIPTAKSAASLQAVRSGVPGDGHHHRIGPARGRHPHHALRHRPDEVHFLRLL